MSRHPVQFLRAHLDDQREQALRERQAEAISQRIEALLNDHERRLTEAFADVREDLSGLKTDVEWLAGERMIEQAIALAQTGSDPDDIGQELGLSRDQAATIAMFRKH